MFECNEIFNYVWTAEHFEIKIEQVGFDVLQKIVLEFVYPISRRIRHEEQLAKRWYWSWGKKDSSRGNDDRFCRLYFLAKKEDHSRIWSAVEDCRDRNLKDILKPGKEEKDVWREFSDKELEWGITLEHVSEMSLMIWKGRISSSDDKYGKTFHHFFQPLGMEAEQASKILSAIYLKTRR